MANRPYGLNDWVKMVGGIYSEQNLKNNLTPSDILLHVIEEAGEVARDFRKEQHYKLKDDLPDVFVWLCAFATRYLITDLEEVVWFKFPGICPYCKRPANCACNTTKTEYIRLHPDLVAARTNREYEHYSLDQWAEMLARLYDRKNNESDVPHFVIGFHLLEELGEIARELRLEDRMSCQEELADAIAWVFAIASKAHLEESFSELVWKRYPGKCYKCQCEVCICPDNCSEREK